ncbi:MAG TPA: hypothetical protein DF383_09040 [Deltaproteobacteria bacterium]|nr:hypothetical protein [Deltaproteobacteria bacterium]
MNKNEQVLEGWKEIGHFLGRYSARHTRRLFCGVKDRLSLEHWLGPKKRIKMSRTEVEEFKKLVQSSRI